MIQILTRTAAIAASLSMLPLGAAAQVQIYGTVDLAFGSIETQSPGAPNAPITKVTGVHSGGLQTSYIGFRGNEDLGGGLTAKFQLEAFFRADTGQIGRFDATPASGADTFFTREAYVGLAGSAGEVRMGANGNPTWLSMIFTSAMGSNSVFSPGFRQMFNGGTRGLSEVDTALVNSVKYISPNFGGLQGSIALQAAEGVGNNSYSGNLVYRSGPVVLTAATSRIRHAATPNVAAVRDQTQTLIGGAYDFGPVRVFGQFANFRNARLGSKDKLNQFGLTSPVGHGVVQFSRSQDKASGTATGTRTTTSLGYVYGLSKRTDVYAFVMSDKVSVGSANSYAVGISHRF